MRKIWVKIFLWGLGLLLIGGILFWWFLFKVPREKIEVIESKLRAEGRVTVFADLEPEPVPESENAAPLYMEAHRLLESLELEKENIYYYSTRQDWPDAEPEMLHSFNILLEDAKFADAMGLLDRAADRSFCQFELDYHAGAEMRIPHISPVLGMSKLLWNQIKIQVDDGDLEGALQSLNRFSSLASRLDEEPLFISQLVRLANIALFKEAMAYVLAHADPDAPSLDEIDKQLNRFSKSPFFPNWMEAERVWALDAWRSGTYLYSIGFGDFWDSSPDILEAIIYLCHFGTTALDELFFIQNSLYLEKVYEKPYYAIDWDAVEKILNEDLPKTYFLTREALGGTITARKKLTRAKAMLQLAGVAVDLYRIRLQSGEFPRDLSGFEAEKIQDPFTGTDLKYLKTGDGFRLYSVGENQMDEQGKKDRKTDEDDVLWSHPYIAQ